MPILFHPGPLTGSLAKSAPSTLPVLAQRELLSCGTGSGIRAEDVGDFGAVVDACVGEGLDVGKA